MGQQRLTSDGCRTTRARRTLALAMVFAAFTFATDRAVAQTDRGTRYDGTNNGYFEYPILDTWDTSVQMTIEAWVYREDDSRCETIVSHDFRESYWLGFCPRLRFYRSGGASADATVDVPANQWTHVAVSYDGTNARFFINGASAGVVPLSHDGAGRVNPLYIGKDPFGAGTQYPFLGSIDELRIWSVARTGSQIAADRNREVRGQAGLVAAFGLGGGLEEENGIVGYSGSGVDVSPFGVLPRDLVIPYQPLAINVDGAIDQTGEYAGAEQMVIRYADGNNAPDNVAYLVRDNDFVYIGIKGAREPQGSQTRAGTFMGIMLDPNGSRDFIAQSGDSQLRAHLDGTTTGWYVGRGTGGWEQCLINLGGFPVPCIRSWEVAFNFCNGEFEPPCIEYKIPKSFFNDFEDPSGIAIGQFNTTLAGNEFVAPLSANDDEPDTWATVTAGPQTLQLPRARFRGTVTDSTFGSGNPISGLTVRLLNAASGSLIAQDTTDADGEYSFSELVPRGVPLRLQLDPCTDCRFANPEVLVDGIGATGANPLEVDFPPCTNVGAGCYYSTVNFRLMVPPGPVSLDRSEPTSGSPAVLVRDNPRKLSTPTTVRLFGENLHTLVRVYLFKNGCTSFPFYCDNVEAPIVRHSPDGSYVDVTVPETPDFNPRRTSSWFWAVQDPWQRVPGPGQYSRGPSFTVSPPQYPLLYGFEFENEGESPVIAEYYSVFRRNAYICAGAYEPFSDNCLGCWVPDPVYALYLPVYLGIMSGINGSCVGMAATSNLLYQGDMPLNSVPEGDFVYYPSGYRGQGDGNIDPPKPDMYSGDLVSCVAKDFFQPANLWAEIRANHGAQFSNEYIRETIRGMSFSGITSLGGDPNDVLAKMRTNPRAYTICMSPELGTGHCVMPYGTEQDATDPTLWRIKIYDNNWPENPNRFIEIDTAANTYRFPRSSGDWTGTGIYAIPISIYQNGNFHMPGLDLLGDFVQYVVFGEADALLTTEDGQEWGWRPDGSTVDNMRGVTVNLFGDDITNELNTAFFIHHMTDVIVYPPTVHVNNRGGDSFFHMAQGGNVFQLQTLDRPAGVQDEILVGTTPDDDRVAGYSFIPGNLVDLLLPAIGQVNGDRQRTVFRWTGLEIPAGGEVGFEALDPDEYGVKLLNNTGGPLETYLQLEIADGVNSITVTRVFGPMVVPDGAEHKAMIADWPDSNQLISLIDEDRDGTPEEDEILLEVSCNVPPGHPADCNGNGIIDGCDIKDGTSLDVNANFIPDECESTGETAGPGGPNFDANGDGIVDHKDLLLFQEEWQQTQN